VHRDFITYREYFSPLGIRNGCEPQFGVGPMNLTLPSALIEFYIPVKRVCSVCSVTNIKGGNRNRRYEQDDKTECKLLSSAQALVAVSHCLRRLDARFAIAVAIDHHSVQVN